MYLCRTIWSCNMQHAFSAMRIRWNIDRKPMCILLLVLVSSVWWYGTCLSNFTNPDALGGTENESDSNSGYGSVGGDVGREVVRKMWQEVSANARTDAREHSVIDKLRRNLLFRTIRCQVLVRKIMERCFSRYLICVHAYCFWHRWSWRENDKLYQTYYPHSYNVKCILQAQWDQQSPSCNVGYMGAETHWFFISNSSCSQTK